MIEQLELSLFQAGDLVNWKRYLLNDDYEHQWFTFKGRIVKIDNRFAHIKRNEWDTTLVSIEHLNLMEEK